MKTILGVFLLLVGASAQAGTCDLISGSFKTTTSVCRYSHDGEKFFNEGHKQIKIAFQERNKALAIVMDVSQGPYTLNYIADGKEQVGRPTYEGNKYIAQCENNHIHTRAEMQGLKRPLITDFMITSDGKMVYQQSFEGSSFVRICEMDRI